MNTPTAADIKIYFENLNVGDDEHENSLPLEHLDLDEHYHIHGGLRIVIGGRTVPHLGFFNEDDVCFNEWILEFDTLLETFDGQENAEYKYRVQIL